MSIGGRSQVGAGGSIIPRQAAFDIMLLCYAGLLRLQGRSHLLQCNRYDTSMDREIFNRFMVYILSCLPIYNFMTSTDCGVSVDLGKISVPAGN